MSNPLVAILMATFNGERYLREQLDSIAAQSHTNWILIISDDGSTDQTLEIAKKWAHEIGVDRVEIRSGPQKGFVQNFLSMACDSGIKAEFYAFSDQDDVWCRDKLKVAVEWMRRADESSALLYCGRTSYVRDDLKVYSRSPLFKKPPSFKNALLQSIAGGNTMLFNQYTKKLLEDVGHVQAVSHDWWVYQLVSGVGGHVYYDPSPQVLYRQHNMALIGGNKSMIARMRRVYMVARGDFARYNEVNLGCIRRAQNYLKPDCLSLLNDFASLREAAFFKRILLIIKCGVYRQNSLDNLAMLLLAALKKM